MVKILSILVFFTTIVVAPAALLKSGHTITIPSNYHFNQQVIIGEGHLKRLDVDLNVKTVLSIDGEQ